MGQPFKKILFTTDLSKDARLIFEQTLSLAFDFEADVVLLHVMEDDGVDIEERLKSLIGGEAYEAMISSHRLNGNREAYYYEALKALCAVNESNIVAADEIIVRRGDPALEIINVASEKKCDIIVMGPDSRGTVNSVVKKGNTFVLTIPHIS